MLTVRDVMTRGVIAVHPETPLADVARLLVEHRISGVPVTDAHGAVLGVVSEADFLIKGQGADAVRHRPLSRFFGESGASRAMQAKIAATTAGAAMTSPAITIGPAASTGEAAGLMTARSVNRLPVVDGGRLVGIVTRADLVRAYTRSDDELARAIREDVLFRALWLDPAAFIVAVTDGVVSITGTVDRRSTAEMVEHVIAMVPGVVAVQADVRWAMDDSGIRPATIDPFFPHSPG